MRKMFYMFFILILLSACSQKEDVNVVNEENEAEVLALQNVKIPDVIFISEKQNSLIDEEEMKLSIKTYLDSFKDLSNAMEPFLNYMGEELTKDERETLEKIKKLQKENDKNFSNYIINNTVPVDYEEESKRISQYITATNELLSELNIKSIIENTKIVNGKEQAKIEDFLNQKKIHTKAFGRQK